MANYETKTIEQYRKDYEKSIKNVNSGKWKICLDPSRIPFYINEYVKNLDKSGYREWEVCHQYFKNAHAAGGNKEILAKALARYLVIFGMNRGKGKGFLKDYNQLIPVVELALSSKYEFLFGLTPKKILESADPVLNICELSKDIKALLSSGRKCEPTNTMISKILMGVYGTVPAFDRYLCASAQCRQVANDRNFPVKHFVRMAKILFR